MPHQSSAADPDAILPVYKAIIAVVTFGVWLLGFVDVFGQGLFSAELHPGFGFYPASFYLFTLVVGLAALRRGYGPTWLEGVASRKVTRGVTVVLWLLTILRMEEQLFELPYLAFLDGVFGAPTEASFISFWLIAFFTLLHSLDAHVVRRRSSRLAWLSYGLLCAIVMLALHQVGDLVLAIGHPDLEGLSLIASVMICSFAGFIASEAPAVGLLYDERTPKTNAFGLAALVVVLVCVFAVGMIVESTLYVLSAGALVLVGLPFALSALRSWELQKLIAAGEMTPEGVLTKFVPERRYFGNTYRPSSVFERLSVYAVFDAPEWQRYVIQAVVTFALAVGAIVLGRMADTPIATIWWANGYLAYCLVLRPKTQWAASVVLFYAVVLFVNLLAGNPFVPSSLLSGVNAVEGVVIATLIVAIFGLRVHGRQLSSVRISVSSYTALILAVTLVHAFGSLIGGGLVTLLFEGSLALNMLTWGSGGLIGSGTILMLFSGKVLEQHLGFKRLEPRIQRFGLFACLYVGTIFALYAFLPVNALLAMPHILFVVLSLPLVLLSSLYQAGRMFVVTSSIYFYFVQSRVGLDGWLTQAKLTLVITIVASIIILALIARYVSAKAREGEKRALDLAPNALLTLDAQRRVLTISKNAQEWFDASEAKLEGRRIDDLFEGFTPHAQAVTDQFQANPTASYTAQVTRTLASGATLTLEVTLQGTGDVSLPYAYVVSVVDVSELQQQRVRLNSALKNAEALLAAGTNAYTVVDENFNRILVSEGAKELFGYRTDAEAVPFLQMYTNITQEKREAQLEQLSALETGRILNFPDIDVMNTPDGRTIFVTRASRWFDNPLRLGRLLWTSLTDVTDLETSRRALETKNLEAEGARVEAEAWLQVLESSPSATLLLDSSFIIRNASLGWTRLTGFSRDETIGRDFVSFLAEEEQDRAWEARQEADKAIQTGGDEAVNTWTLRTNSGAKLQVTIMANAVAGSTVKETMFVSSVTNITELATQKALADTLLNRNAAMIISQSDDWKIQTCSDAWINQLGYTREETVGHDLTEFMEPEDAVISKEFRETLKSQNASKNMFRNTLRFRTKAGELRQIELQSVVEELAGSLSNIITLVDVTDMMRTQHQLQMLVSHDELTGLYSRRGLKEQRGDGTRKKDAGVYIFDLDHFKSVNDSYGHEAGDALLSAIGQTMMRLTETVGCAARLGGEEFAIIRPWQGWDKAKEFGEVLRLALEQTVVVSSGRTISRTASIGIAKLGASEALSDVMRLADDFAREAKLRGRNMVCAGEEEELRALALRGAFITAEEVQLGLEAGEFYYAVQPIWDVEARRIEGFEALIRWQKADGTVLSPLQFVSVFDEVTREPAFAALNTAMRKDVLTKLSDFPDAYVSFNYTLEQLAYVGAAEALMGIYGSAKDFPGRVIMIELSEMALSQRGDFSVLGTELKVLGENGFIIALDDFGVESSNLYRLQELTIHAVKLDKTLIDDLTTSERVRSIVSGIAMIVRSLNMKVIVEGVETTQQAQALMHHHIVTQQGYVHAKPMRPEEVVGQLSKIGADVVIGESAEKALDIL